MVGSRAEKHHSSRVGKNCVMMGFCRYRIVCQASTACSPQSSGPRVQDADTQSCHVPSMTSILTPMTLAHFTDESTEADSPG